MDWNKLAYALVGPILMIVMLLLWRSTDNTEAEFRTITEKVDTLDTKFDTKFDTLNQFLTDNFIAINHDIGEIEGPVSHPSPRANNHSGKQPGYPRSIQNRVILFTGVLQNGPFYV